jgi:HlyD family secretion protein
MKNLMTRPAQQLTRKQDTPAAEALAFQSDASEIALTPVPRAARLLLYTLLALLVSAALWASFATIDRVVTASGRIATEAPQIVIQPFETAIIRELKVKAGDHVVKGQLLAALDPTFAAADSGAVQQRLNQLQAEALRLETELNNATVDHYSDNAEIDALNRQVAATRRASLEGELATFEAQTRELAAQLDSRSREIEDVRQQLATQRELEKARQELYDRKVGSLLNLLEARNARVAADRDLNKLLNAIKEIRAQMATVQQKRTAFIADWRNKAAEQLKTTQAEIDKLSQEQRKSERRRDLVQLTAPADAVVLELAPRSIGSVVREAETLLTLVPQHSPLQVVAELDPADVARVKPGDPVTLKLEALPFQRHGVLQGTLKVVSQDRVGGAGIQSAGMETGAQSVRPTSPVPASRYRAVISIDDNQLRDLPPDFQLLPGMNLSAEIKVGQRRLIDYFLYPILQAGQESFREP